VHTEAILCKSEVTYKPKRSPARKRVLSFAFHFAIRTCQDHKHGVCVTPHTPSLSKRAPNQRATTCGCCINTTCN
jgi:hypothetical protein